MKPSELKQTQQTLGLNMREFADLLNTPYRTVQDWMAGRRRIPGVVEVAVKCLLEAIK